MSRAIRANDVRSNFVRRIYHKLCEPHPMVVVDTTV
jgi:hypothetical protein